MPYKKPNAPVLLHLPSDPSYWVKWKPFLTYGDMKAVTLGSVKPAEATTRPSSAVEDYDREAITDGLLLAHIAEWNLDDEDGGILPLTADSLAVLEDVDVNFLSEELASRLQQKDESRKNSVTSTGPSSKAPSTAKAKPR